MGIVVARARLFGTETGKIFSLGLEWIPPARA